MNISINFTSLLKAISLVLIAFCITPSVQAQKIRTESVEGYREVSPPERVGKPLKVIYLKHRSSGKYLCSGNKNNGGKFWMWGPRPQGHEKAYQFELISSGNAYLLRHRLSGKYLCSDNWKDGGQFWMWGPIPQGHLPMYQFKLNGSRDGYYTLRHIHSGKYLCSGEWKNGGQFWMWGPIPNGHLSRYQFKFEEVNTSSRNTTYRTPARSSSRVKTRATSKVKPRKH